MAENQSTVQKVSVLIQFLTFHTHYLADAIADRRTDRRINQNRAPVLRTKEYYVHVAAHVAEAAQKPFLLVPFGSGGIGRQAQKRLKVAAKFGAEPINQY